MKNWIQAFRLRTLPLAAASVIMGTMLAGIYGEADWTIFFFCLLIAVELQVLSNLANDYGDFAKGTDNENRVGNQRALQSGAITPAAMKRMIIFFVILSLTTGILLLRHTYTSWNSVTLLLLGAGIAAIAAAIKYTVGKSPYGYRGLGDIAVFLFFGLFAVLATAYLQAGTFRAEMLLPAMASGLLATAVLNVNNIRDIENDRAFNKITIPVRIGLAAARKYHLLLVSSALVLLLVYALLQYSNPAGLLFLLAYPLFIRNTWQVMKLEPSPEFNKLLKTLSLSILFLSLLYAVSFTLSSVIDLASIFKYVE